MKNKLCTLKMEKDEGVASFFTKISRVRDQLLVIGVKVDDDDLVQTVVDGLPSFWETFLSVVNGREVQPNFERLWHDCLQEEGRMQSKNGGSKEGNRALAVKTKERKKSSIKRTRLRSLKVSTLIYQILNVLIVTRWDIMPKIVEWQR